MLNLNKYSQEDGATSRINLLWSKLLKSINDDGELNWPIRLPDLTPVDYFFLKLRKMYVEKPTADAKLKNKIRREINKFEKSYRILKWCLFLGKLKMQSKASDDPLMLREKPTIHHTQCIDTESKELVVFLIGRIHKLFNDMDRITLITNLVFRFL